MPSASGKKGSRQKFIHDIRKYLQSKLPGHLVPADFVICEKLPLTSNGKIDRKALPVPEAANDAAYQEEKSGELSPSAGKIGDIVRSVLKIESLNPLTNLFNLGTTSIQIVIITNQLQSKLGYRPAIDELYANPTIAAIARKYDKFIGEHAGEQKTSRDAEKTRELVEKVKSLSDDEAKSRLI